MLAKDARAGTTPVAPDRARPPAGKVTGTQQLVASGDGGGTAPVAYLAGDRDQTDAGNGSGVSLGVIDAEAELISILARLEFMGTFVDVGADRSEIVKELTYLRQRIDAVAGDLAPARHDEAITRLRATEDVVLAGLQERVVGAAEAQEQAGVDDDDPAGRARVLDYAHTTGWGSDVYDSGSEVMRSWTDETTGAPRTGEFQWCGAFAGYNYVTTGGLDPELRRVFASGSSMSSFFRYSWSSRNLEFIWADGRWIDVEVYHRAHRGAPREWWSEAEIRDLVAAGGFAALPIRPGDIVIINNDDDDGSEAKAGPADHVAMVQSWDGAGTLITIEGNAVRLDGTGQETVEDGISRDVELHRTANGHGGKRVHGIGRPSIVDLEVHSYSRDDSAPPP